MLNIFDMIRDSLIKNSEYNRHGYYADDEVIACKSKFQADAIANLLEDCGYDVVHTAFDDDEMEWIVYLDG